MKIHEYQAKQLIKQYGIKIPAGKVAYTPLEAKKVAVEVSKRGPWMLKAQIQSGARNKGRFLEKSAGRGTGIRYVTSRREIAKEAEEMLRHTLVTSQTGPKGRIVTRLYVEEFCKVNKIFYTGLVIDRISAVMTLLIANLEKTDILTIAAKTPNKILHVPLDTHKGITAKQVREVGAFIGISERHLPNLRKYLRGIFKAFVETDATMLEINPAGITARGDIIALDIKLTVDDQALFRQPEIVPLFDECEFEKRELIAFKNGFQYNSFDGSVGCIVNGEGIALGLMDLIKSKGGSTACFLNLKGGVDQDKVASGIRLIMTNPRVEGILIVIIGGFLRCNLVAEGILSVASEVGLNVPVVVRFEGTNKYEGESILKNARYPITITQDVEEGVSELLQAMEDNN